MTWIASYHGFTVDGNTPTTSDEVYIDPGLTKTIKFKYRNDGTDTWSKTGSNPVRLGTASPQNRASGFADNGSGGLNTGWLSISGYPKSRIEMVESSVTPGNYAHFEAVFKGMPEATNVYAEGFQPLAESLTWMGGATTLHCDMRPIGTTLFNWPATDGDGHYRWGVHPNAPTQSTTDIPKIGNGTTVDDGYYSAMNPDVAYRKLELLKECGFNFLLLNYDGHGGIAERGMLQIIKQIQDNSEFGHFRYAPFMTMGSGFSEFNYLYDLAADAHWARWNSKPMICTWGSAGSSDNRFVMPSMGANDTNTTWHWETFGTGAPSPVLHDAGTIIPRIDDRVCVGTYGKTTATTWNIDLNTSMYADQFNTVKTAWNNRTIKFCFINAWDEYHERQGPIEPHEDISVEGPTVNRNSSVNSDTYLFDITKGYIDQLRS